MRARIGIPTKGTLALAVVSVAALVASCGGSPEDSGGAANGAQEEVTEMVFAGAGGTYQEAYTEVFDAFTKETGIKVNYVTGTLETAFSQVRPQPPQSVDLLLTNSVTQVTGQTQGVYESIDESRIPNLAHAEAASDLPEGSRYGVPVHYSGLGIVYNTEKFQQAGIPAPTSWLDLWNPKLSGRVAVTDPSVSYAWDFITVMAELEGGSVTDVGPGLKKIAELRDMGVLAQCPTTLPELATLFQQDAVWAAVNTRTRAADLKGLPVKFVSPEPTGATLFENYLAIPVGAKGAGAAHQLIDFLLSTESQKTLSDRLAQGPVRDDVDTALNDLLDSNDLLSIDRSEQVPLIDSYISGWRNEVGDC